MTLGPDERHTPDPHREESLEVGTMMCLMAICFEEKGGISGCVCVCLVGDVVCDVLVPTWECRF